MQELNSTQIAQVSGGSLSGVIEWGYEAFQLGVEAIEWGTGIAGGVLNAVGSGLDLGADVVGVFIPGYQGISGPILHGVGDAVAGFGSGNIGAGVSGVLSAVEGGVSAGIADAKLFF